MKNKQINTISNQQSRQSSKSSIINIENSDVLEIFGINNENLSYFESSLPLKIFQKGNELNIKGEKKYRNILRNVIFKTLTEIKLNKDLREKNLIQENLKMQLLNDIENIENFTIENQNNPTYLKYTVYKNYGRPNQIKKVMVINLSEVKQKINLDKLMYYN